MKRRSLWLVVGALLATLLFAFVGCRKTTTYELNEKQISMTVGEDKQLTVTPAPDKEVSWKSDDEGVATVADGLVHAVGKGSTTVTATIEGVKDALTCAVTVTEETTVVEGYRLDYALVSIKTGESFQIGVLKEDGSAATGVTYSSDDPSIATVSAAGLIEGVAKGETKIKAKVEGGTLVCTVKVAQSYTYSLYKTSLDIAAGATERITLITTPADSESTRPHTFTSTNPDVATVEGGTGKVTGVAKGTAEIVCAVDGQEVKATVTVTEYTVKIDGAAISEEITMGIGASKTVEVTADPVREFTPDVKSSDASVVAYESGSIVAKGEGTAVVTVTVGGRDFQTTVKVISGYSINFEKATLTLGATDGSNTIRLKVTDGSGADANATFESSATNVATVASDGTVTAVSFGTATITATYKDGADDKTFETAITVVPASSMGHVDLTFGKQSVNLTYLDANKTIDWRQYSPDDNNPLRMANNAGLIGDFATGNTSEHFWDYKAPVLTEDGEDGATSSRTYGISVHGSYTVPVKLTSDVSKVVILTGAWKETGTIQFKIGDVVLQEHTFTGGQTALARAYTLTVDTSMIGASDDVTLTIAVNCNRQNGGNVSLVAVAAIGKTAHEHTPNATVSATVTTPNGEQNLTEEGMLDWAAADGTRKAGVPADSIINIGGITRGKGSGSADDYKDASFTWTDGTKAATADNRPILWGDQYTNIPVLLYKGTSTVTVWSTGYISGFLVAVYDDNGVFLGGYQVADEHSGSITGKVAITLNVKETGTYTFAIRKCRGGGNCGWGAITVSGESDIVPEKTQYDLVVGGTATAKIDLTGTATGVEFASGNTAVATVSADGTVTAVGVGSTYIKLTTANSERRVFVTVTQYTLESSDSVTLSIGATSKINITANPAGAFTASYQSSAESIATVSADGTITAVAEGTAKITVTVGGKTFEITVEVAGYELSDTEITLKAGKDVKETKTLSLLDDEGTAVAGTTFASSNENVATVNETTGLITAVGVGTATITVNSPTGSALTCTVNVEIPDATSNLVELDMSFENLSRVSAQYKTIDYKHWHSGGTTEMDGRENLIGTPTGLGGGFWDYKTTVGYEFNETGNRNVGMSYGVSSNGFEIPVTINSQVSQIVFYTGAYKGTATVTFKIGDRVLATQSFTADEGIARKIVLSLDTDAMIANDTLTIVGSISKSENSGNVNVVALAIVGKTEYAGTEVISGSATLAVKELSKGENGKPTEENKVNLTDVGTLDWIYSHYENPNEPFYHKIGGSVITASYYKPNGDKYDGGRERDGFSAFMWTDGMRSDATDEPADKTNPQDNDVGFDGYTNNYNTATGEIHIGLSFAAAGKYTVTLYLNSYRASEAVGLYDANNNFMTGKLLVGEHDGGKGWVVTFTIETDAASEYKVVIGKARSHDATDRQVGWQAVAVAKIDDEA